ncbi:MAG TPA: LPS assembly lipoprotein LptE [Burkholderiales bacterium]|nr:LPS assembly lipoprotein LptE [Burkholderiales bacterium]
MRAEARTRKVAALTPGKPALRTETGYFTPHPALFVLLATVLLLSSCGFHLRGPAALPFESMYVQAAPTSLFATQLKRAVISGSTTRVADNPKDAQVTLQILGEAREKQILSLSGAGRVSEFRLRYRVSYRVVDTKSTELVPPSEIVLQRDFAFNDQEVLSKESEEALLYRDMQNDAVQQLVRRLQASRINAKS